MSVKSPDSLHARYHFNEGIIILNLSLTSLTFSVILSVIAVSRPTNAVCGTTHTHTHINTKRHKNCSVSNIGILSPHWCPLHEKKGRQTCWSFLLILLTLVAIVELRKGLRGLLQPRHKDLDVVQGAVQYLLNETNPERGAGLA